ncbi:MAG: anti-sigma-factor antagonist [Frankiales bacterium]|nr:anti-sigma-factor antagonist [Frankiales bacterium]
MRVWRSISTNVAVVTPLGELDLAAADELREALEEACNGSRLVLVDLAGVTFLDSTTIGVLVGASKRCTEAGKEFQVINAWGICLKVLRLTGLTGLMGEKRAPVLLEHLTG